MRIDPGDMKGTASLSVRTASRVRLGKTRRYFAVVLKRRVTLDPATGVRTVKPTLTAAGIALLKAHSSLKVVVRVVPDGGLAVTGTSKVPGQH